MMAQTVGKVQPRLNFNLDGPAIDFKSYRHGFRALNSTQLRL
jgi:hypothetical protein